MAQAAKKELCLQLLISRQNNRVRQVVPETGQPIRMGQLIYMDVFASHISSA